MIVLKVILFIAALLFFFIGITFFSSSDEEIGTPFIILGAAALVVAILLCFKLYLASKITLAAAAGLLLLLGIGNMGDSEETAGLVLHNRGGDSGSDFVRMVHELDWGNKKNGRGRGSDKSAGIEEQRAVRRGDGSRGERRRAKKKERAVALHERGIGGQSGRQRERNRL